MSTIINCPASTTQAELLALIEKKMRIQRFTAFWFNCRPKHIESRGAGGGVAE